MNELKKYNLSFLPTITYFKEALNEVNMLSSCLLDLINFENGCFYTCFPEDIDLKKLYKFQSGGISGNTYSETAYFILRKLKSNSDLSCIIDDVIRSVEDKNLESFKAKNLFFKEEVYYLIQNSSATYEVILKCLHETDAIWHSLCVLTEADLGYLISSALNEENIKDICIKTRLIAIGAYDGEGYVFWERDTPQF
jgi:hypothetical protein